MKVRGWSPRAGGRPHSRWEINGCEHRLRRHGRAQSRRGPNARVLTNLNSTGPAGGRWAHQWTFNAPRKSPWTVSTANGIEHNISAEFFDKLIRQYI